MTFPHRQGVRGSRSIRALAQPQARVRGLQGKLFCVICRTYRPKIRSQGGIHQQENVVPSGERLGMKKSTRQDGQSADAEGRVGPYASVRDAKLRTTLKMHDLCVFLITTEDEEASKQILQSMFYVVRELEEFYYGPQDI